MASSSSSSRNWRYDVFPNFNGKDVRTTFLSHFLKELDRKLITSFEDNGIERSRHSIGSELIQAIKDSRIAVVVFSQNYASSSWCLDELVEILKCKEEFGQMVIPIFYHLDPSDVRKQTGEFGKIFQETCKNKTEEVKIQWKRALTDVANIGGYHSVTWGNEAKMIEGIANDILVKLRLTPRKDSEKLVGIEAHMAKMISLLELESDDVRMVGIWGPSGIGKTTIARVLYSHLSRRFQGSVYVDRALISKSMENYPSASAKPVDYNMKLHLQKNILSEILGKRDIKIDHLGAVGKRLKCLKVLIFIDDFDDQVVQDALADQTYWFGGGSRIIVTAKDKRLLMAHRINHRYEVRLPSEVEFGAGNLLNQNKEERCQLSEGFNHFPRKLKLLTWEKDPSIGMASHLEKLGNLQIRGSKLEKLWEGVHPLPRLKKMDLWGSKHLKELPDLSMATNLKFLDLNHYSSLVELPSSISKLQSLSKLYLYGCSSLMELPSSISKLHSLSKLDFRECSGLWSGKREQPLPSFLTTLRIENIPSLVELPSSIKNLQKLKDLSITGCTNLETLPAGMKLKYLNSLDLSGCSRLRSIPDISTNISDLILSYTAIEEVPWWIGKLARLVNLHMENCNKLEHVYMDISKLKHLLVVNFSSCWALTGADLSGLPSGVVMEADNSGTELPGHEDTSYSLPDDFVPKVKLNFTNCVSLDQETLLQQQSVLFGSMILSGEEVPSYFTHRTFKNSLTNIPLLQRSPSQPLFRLRVCAVVDSKSISRAHDSFSIKVCCRFIDRLGNHFDSVDWALDFWKTKLGCQLFIFDCCFPLHEDNAPLAELKYDHVDIQFRLIDNCSQLKLKGCGVRFLEDGPSMDDGDNCTEDNLGGLDTEHCKEFGDTAMMSSLHNWVYHVFLSFNGEDACIASLIDSLKKMDQKLIIAFNDNEMERSQSISPELVHTIKDSRIAVVVFSKNYASSSWCLNELVEILKCKEKLGQTVIPIFYGLDPYDIRKQSGDFGEIFKNTCKHKTKELKNRWRVALTDAANIPGYHSVTWDNEAKMIEEIANDVLSKLNLTPTMKQIEMSHDHDSYCSRQEELHEVDSETDGILWDAKWYVNAEDTESVQGGAKFNEKSIRGDNFLGAVNSDATSSSQKIIANKMAGPVKVENKHGKLSKSSTMVTYKRQMSHDHDSYCSRQEELHEVDSETDGILWDAKWYVNAEDTESVQGGAKFNEKSIRGDNFLGAVNSDATSSSQKIIANKMAGPVKVENKHGKLSKSSTMVTYKRQMSHDHDSYCSRQEELHEVDSETDGILWDAKWYVNAEDTESVQGGAKFNEKSIRGDNFLGAVNSDATSSSQKIIANKMAGPVKVENKHGKLSKSSTMVTYKRQMSHDHDSYCSRQEELHEVDSETDGILWDAKWYVNAEDTESVQGGAKFNEKSIRGDNFLGAVNSDATSSSQKIIANKMAGPVKVENKHGKLSKSSTMVTYKRQMSHDHDSYCSRQEELHEVDSETDGILWDAKWYVNAEDTESVQGGAKFNEKSIRGDNFLGAVNSDATSSSQKIIANKMAGPVKVENKHGKLSKSSTMVTYKRQMSHDHDSYCSRQEELHEVDSETDGILWDAKWYVNAEDTESVQGGAKFNEKSIRGDNFLGAVNSDATSSSQKIIANKMAGPVKVENKHGKLSKSSHQVFINFWGEEVRFSFICHLVSAFSREGVNTYIGNYEKRVEDLRKTFQTIEESNIALVVFSSRYTESRWCLDELVKIKERLDEGKLLIIPIFYEVKPSQVQQLEGDFGLRLWNLWRIHRDHRIIKWKDALEYVASGMDFCLKEHSSESEFITLIVEKVMSRIVLLQLQGENPSFICTSGRGKTTELSTIIGEKHENVPNKCPLFGLEQRMKQLEEKLEFNCNETRIIGVVGMAGIGKTTLAMMLHKKWNCKFVRCVPLLGIRKMAEDHKPAWLRKTLLEVLLGGKFPVINDKMTHESLKDKLLQTKVFIVLDDVSDKKQLKFLLSDLNWIKNGSKIVITSRDKSLIEEFVHDTYVVPPLNYGEALQLFSYHAFVDHVVHPSVTSTKLGREFLDCAGGIPLIIKLLGKQLQGRDEAKWEIRQEDLTHLAMLILNIFKSSCDELSAKQKDVFLDIACFFRSENDYFVRTLLDSGDHNTESEVRDLTYKCMIAISGGRVEMHDLLYMFGKIFSSQAFIEENGGQSRLWCTQEIIDALINQKDTKRMRGIFLDMSEVTEGMVLPRLTFIHMINLRYLKIDDSCCPQPCKALCKLHFPDGLKFTLEKVRYLHWVNFPLKELPSDFRPENLVDLRLPYSMVERVWQGVKDTPQLKWVDLSHSNNLLNLSGLAKAESLMRLNLEGCTNLDELPGEMQNMKSLVYLNLRGCTRLSSLPKMNLISLKTLILSKCSNLEEFLVISNSLEVLHLDGTAIKKLPPSIKNLQRLVLFNLKNCKRLVSLPNCLGELIVLEELILSGCSRLKNLPDVEQSMKHVQILLLDGTGAKEMPNISCFTGSNGQVSVDMLQPSGSYLSEWPRGFDGVYSLRRLCLSGNDFVSLQNDIGQLYNLTWLDVKQCTKLRSVPMLPPRLQYFDAHGCDSLEKVANPLAVLVLTEQVHAMFNFSNCNKLDQDAQDSIISYTRRRSQLMLGALSRYNGGFTLEPLVGTCFPGWDVPEWFSHRGSGSVLQPKQPPHWCDNRFTGIALCAVILFPGYHEQRNRLLVNCKCEFENEEGSSIHFSCTVGGWNELSNTPQKMELSHVFIGYTSRLDISTRGGYDEEKCFCAKSSFEFEVTDGTKKVEGCEVLQCGFSLVYATDDRENICLDAKTVAVPKRVKNVPAEEMPYGNSRRDDDIQYQSYSGPTMRTHESFCSERKSDAIKNLRKSFENKRFDLFKNPGGEITISSNHHNTPTENVEKPSLVGVELRLKQLEKVLYSTPGKTRIVGVIGMPGIGKSTLANILFEKHGCKFPRSFSLTVSKEYIPEELKKMYLAKLLEHTRNIREDTTDESLRDNSLQTKMFVVLENVSDKKQLEFLLANLYWIKKGSKIVVTACDKSLVEGLAHETYVVPQLNNKEAFQVFSYHAFDGKICIPTETFLSLSKLFVDNVGGNPLALKLLGSELCGKDEAYWKHELQSVVQISNTKIQDVWRFYTDQLTQRHKDVLLDIACFFRSEDEYFIRSLMDSGDPDSTDDVSEVRDLAEKFLITICDGRVEINDRDYTSCKNLGSPEVLRLMKYKDILDKLRKTNQQEANTVRGIFFDMSELIHSIALERTTFINMHNLRYLKIYESCCSRKGKYDCKLQFPDGLDFPLEEVRYFHWLKYPLEELPPDLRPENLVDLRLPYSKVKHLWEGVKDTPRLKWVDLSHSSKLLSLSALSKAESLQRLDLEGCTSLKELPGDMQNMKSLIYLNLRGCLGLRSLPKMNLISLKTLILSDCSNLKEFQVISESLEVLHLDGTAIKGLPLSILKLQRLVVLNLKNCKMLECLPNFLGKLKVLEEIILSGCSKLKNLPDVRHSMKHVQILLFDGAGVDEMPNISCFIGSQGQASVDMPFQNFGSYGNPSEWPRCGNRVSSLRRLCLSGNDFVSLQNDIGKLNNLIWLDVKQCKKLRSVPMLPPRLQYFDAHGCESLERVANPLALQVVTEQIHATYNFSNCNKLDQDATDAIISYTRWKSELILNALSRYNGGFALQALVGTCFPGWEVPAWFSYRASGSLLEPKLPPHWCDSRFTGIALCAVILFPAYRNQRNNLLVKCNLKIKNEDGSRSSFSFPVGGWNEPGETIDSSHVFIGYASKLDIKKLHEDNEEGCNHTEASFEFQVTDGTKELRGCKVLKCGFSLVYESDDLQVNSGEHETTTEANQDITSSTWIQDFFGYIFLAFSCVIVLAILGFCVRVFAPQYYMTFSDFSWPLLARTLFFVAYGLFLKAGKTKPIT